MDADMQLANWTGGTKWMQGCIDGVVDVWMERWMGRYTYVEEFNVVGLDLA